MTGEKNSSSSISGTDRNSDDSISIADEETCGFQFGCGKCRTKTFPIRFLSCCNNAKGILCFVSLAVFIQGMAVNGLVNIVISTLEKRFHLRSSETGFVAGCYDLGFLIAVPLVSYVGGRGRKPQWIGWGVFVMGLGSITFSLPHFVAPTYTISNLETFICDNNITTTECGESHLRVYRAFFIVGQLLHGIGATALYTLVLTYLDANVKQSSSSVYHGIFFAVSMAGPGVGFLLGGYFIRFYTNLGENVTVDEISPVWVGNWWLGYILCGALAIFLSIPIIMYPKQLPNTSQYRKDRDQEMNQNPQALKAKEDETFGKSIKDVPQALLVVLRNATLVLLSISGAMDSGIVIALATFGPKYTEAMFRLSPSSAGIYFGIATIVSACTAQLIGGILVSKLKWKVKTMLKLCMACATATFGCLFVFLIQCENPEVPGVNVPFNGENSFVCEGSCGCNTILYDPVCGDDNLTYLSFCEAVCIKSDDGYTNCSKVSDLDPSISTARSGKCEVDSCLSVLFPIGFAALAVFFTCLKFQPALQVSLRTVPLRQRSFAIGIQWVIMRCLGYIPLPLILGSLLDSSCLVWGNVCGECGSCKLYDNARMAKYMTTLFTIAKGISITCLVAAYVTYKPPPTDYEEAQMNEHAKTEDDIAENFSNTKENNVETKSCLSIASNPYDNEVFSY